MHSVKGREGLSGNAILRHAVLGASPHPIHTWPIRVQRDRVRDATKPHPLAPSPTRRGGTHLLPSLFRRGVGGEVDFKTPPCWKISLHVPDYDEGAVVH